MRTTPAKADGAAPIEDRIELSDAEQALVLAVSEQAQLLAMLTGAVRAGLESLDEEPPSGAVDVIGALGPLESPGTPGADPLRAFGTVAPRFVLDAAQVVGELSAAGAHHDQ